MSHKGLKGKKSFQQQTRRSFSKNSCSYLPTNTRATGSRIEVCGGQVRSAPGSAMAAVLGWPWMTLGLPGVQGQSTQDRLTGVPGIQPELGCTESQAHFLETCYKKPVRPAALIKSSGN